MAKYLHPLSPQPPIQPVAVPKAQTQLEFFSTLDHVHEWLLNSSTTLDDADDHPSYQHNSVPIWKLLLLLETLLLHPITATEPKSPDTVVLQHLNTFRQGDIQRLYHQGASTPTVREAGPAHFAADDDPCPSAQSLANADNLCAAYQRVQSSLPTAKITPPVKILCQNLYPCRIHSSEPIPTARTRSHNRSSTTTSNNPEIPIKESLIFETLSKLKPGTAGGPFTDLTDVLKSYALY
jgi:hypothetical protein